MADFDNLGLEEGQGETSSLAPWQQFLRKWQGPIAFGPLALLIFVTLRFFANARANWLFMTLIFATVLWSIIIVGYALYLKYIE